MWLDNRVDLFRDTILRKLDNKVKAKIRITYYWYRPKLKKY